MPRANSRVNIPSFEMQKSPPAEAEGPKLVNCVIPDFGLLFLRYAFRRANSSRALTVG